MEDDEGEDDDPAPAHRANCIASREPLLLAVSRGPCSTRAHREHPRAVEVSQDRNKQHNPGTPEEQLVALEQGCVVVEGFSSQPFAKELE